jgi:hypothetical protein
MAKTPVAVKVAVIGAVGVVIAALGGPSITAWLTKPMPPQQVQNVQNAPGATIIQGGPGSVFNIAAKTEGPPTQPGLAGDLARLRHAGQKRFWAWWESCFDANRRTKPTDPAIRAEAERIRLQIYEKLERNLGTAEAILFNTPAMNEPFPPNSTLPLCPEGIEIKEFGYRLDRLTKIIERLQQQRSAR